MTRSEPALVRAAGLRADLEAIESGYRADVLISAGRLTFSNITIRRITAL